MPKVSINAVVNNSGNPVYLKDEDSNAALKLRPGEQIVGQFDGFYSRGHSGVYKLQDFQAAWIHEDGSVSRTPDVPGYESGGWKSDAWVTSNGWGGFVSNANLYSTAYDEYVPHDDKGSQSEKIAPL